MTEFQRARNAQHAARIDEYAISTAPDEQRQMAPIAQPDADSPTSMQ